MLDPGAERMGRGVHDHATALEAETAAVARGEVVGAPPLPQGRRLAEVLRKHAAILVAPFRVRTLTMSARTVEHSLEPLTYLALNPAQTTIIESQRVLQHIIDDLEKLEKVGQNCRYLVN